MFSCPEQHQDGIHEHAHDECKHRGDPDGKIQRKRACSSRLIYPLLPEKPGDKRASADPRKAGKAEGNIKYGQDQRSSCHHVRIIRPAHIKCIRHIIDQYDDLTDDRRHDHRPQCGTYGHIFKHVIAFMILLRLIFLCLILLCLFQFPHTLFSQIAPYPPRLSFTQLLSSTWSSPTHPAPRPGRTPVHGR